VVEAYLEEGVQFVALQPDDLSITAMNGNIAAYEPKIV
jgi:hypothetical protein